MDNNREHEKFCARWRVGFSANRPEELPEGRPSCRPESIGQTHCTAQAAGSQARLVRRHGVCEGLGLMREAQRLQLDAQLVDAVADQLEQRAEQLRRVATTAAVATMRVRVGMVTRAPKFCIHASKRAAA